MHKSHVAVVCTVHSADVCAILSSFGVCILSLFEVPKTYGDIPWTRPKFPSHWIHRDELILGVQAAISCPISLHVEPTQLHLRLNLEHLLLNV